jgi:hypothetical protein
VVGTATVPPHDPVTPRPGSDVRAIPDTPAPARMKRGKARPNPANDESDLQES